jgi:hypothetical protein
MHVWVYDPHSGVVKIRSYVESQYAGKFNRLGIHFHGVFCYIEAYTEPMVPSASLLPVDETREKYYLERCRNVPLHLCRLRFFGDEER